MQKKFTKLHSSWSVDGNDIRSFNEEIFDLANRTQYLSIYLHNLDVLSYIGTSLIQKEEVVNYYVIDDEKSFGSAKCYYLDQCGPLLEDFEKTGILLRKEGYWMAIEPKVLEDIVGTNLNTIPSGHSRAFLLKTLLKQGEDKSVVKNFLVREEEIGGLSHKKIFNTYGNRYVYMSQNMFFKAAQYKMNSLKNFTFYKYHIDNQLSEVFYRCENLGISIKTSDTSACGYTISSFIKGKDGDYRYESFVEQHILTDFDDFFENIEPIYKNLKAFDDSLKKNKEKVIKRDNLANSLLSYNNKLVNNNLPKKELKSILEKKFPNPVLKVQDALDGILSMASAFNIKSNQEKAEHILLKALGDYIKNEMEDF